MQFYTVYCMLEWVAFPFSGVSSQPRDQNQVSGISGGFFTSWATGEANILYTGCAFSMQLHKLHISYIYNHYTYLCVYMYNIEELFNNINPL